MYFKYNIFLDADPNNLIHCIKITTDLWKKLGDAYYINNYMDSSYIYTLAHTKKSRIATLWRQSCTFSVNPD